MFFFFKDFSFLVKKCKYNEKGTQIIEKGEFGSTFLMQRLALN